MAQHHDQTFGAYPKNYIGKSSFVDFANVLLKPTTKAENKKLHLIERAELQERFSNYCQETGKPKASNVNIGRHLGYFGVKCDTKIGPAGAQLRFYSGMTWIDGSKTSKKSAVRALRRKRMLDKGLSSIYKGETVLRVRVRSNLPNVEEPVRKAQLMREETGKTTQSNAQTVGEIQSAVRSTQSDVEEAFQTIQAYDEETVWGWLAQSDVQSQEETNCLQEMETETSTTDVMTVSQVNSFLDQLLQEL